MQVFVPYKKPFECAVTLDKKRLNKQIIECNQIIKAIKGESKAWANHPCTIQYKSNFIWLIFYRDCLAAFKDGDSDTAKIISDCAEKYTPIFLTEDFCINMRKRLFTKSQELYIEFKEYGTTDENWYYSPEKNSIIKYIKGKKLN